jgi:hypothetical protein
MGVADVIAGQLDDELGAGLAVGIASPVHGQALGPQIALDHAHQEDVLDVHGRRAR